MNPFIFLILLVLSQTTSASVLSASDQLWLSRSIYHECREKLICSREDWRRIAKVAENRRAAFSVWKFGAKCPTLACIVRSKEYTSHRRLLRPIKDIAVFEEIQAFVQAGDFGTSSYLFFSTKGKGRHRRMSYRGNINNLLNTGDNPCTIASADIASNLNPLILRLNSESTLSS